MLAPLAVLGAAPARARGRGRADLHERLRASTVAMRDGLLAYFGNATLPHAKWLSLARVLADPSSAGASYIDVRLPARPAAGFPAGVTPPAAAAGGEAGAAATPAEPSSTSEGTIAALAASLTASGGGSVTSSGEAPAGAAGSTSGEPAAAGGGRHRQLTRRRRIDARRPLCERGRAERRNVPDGAPAGRVNDNEPRPEVEGIAEGRSQATGRGSRDLQRTLRESSPSLTGRSSLHNVHNPVVRRPVCCQP